MMIATTIVGAVSLNSVQYNTSRYMKVKTTATKTIYIDKKSVELENVISPYCEIEAKRIIVDRENKKITKLEETYYFDNSNKDIIRYVVEEKDVYDFDGHEIYESDLMNKSKILTKGDDKYEYGNIVYSLIYGHSFSK